MSNSLHNFLLVLVMALVTYGIRAFPFIVFKKRIPQWIIFLGQVFPYAIMAILFIYSMKDLRVTEGNQGIATFISCATVFLIHKWQHKTLLSIIAGTIIYMLLVQLVF